MHREKLLFEIFNLMKQTPTHKSSHRENVLVALTNCINLISLFTENGDLVSLQNGNSQILILKQRIQPDKTIKSKFLLDNM